MTEEVEAHVEKRYELVAKLGKGAYGIVWRAVDRKTKAGVAVKKVFDAFSNQTDAQRTYREVMFLQKLHHENIVKLLNVMRAANRKDIYLVFELMETDLYATIRCNILQDIHKQFITYQLLRCIRFLHDRQIIHRDLKPANLLLNSDCHCKLADFGLARSLVTIADEQKQRPVLTDYIATRWYRPPEIVLGSVEYTKAVDMWAVGCIVAEMLTGKPLFPGTSTVNQLERLIAATGIPSTQDIASIKSAFAEELIGNLGPIPPKPLRGMLASQPREAIDLVSRLIVFNPTKRLAAGEALRHPYVAAFVSAEDLEQDKPEPIVLQVPDFERLSVDEYRDALYRDIARKKKEARRRKREKRERHTSKEKEDVGAAGGGRGGDDYDDDLFEEGD